MTALHLAASNDDKELCFRLLSGLTPEQARVLCNATDTSGKTALHLAAAYGNMDIIQRLIEINPSGIDALTMVRYGRYCIGKRDALDESCYLQPISSRKLSAVQRG